LFLCHGNGSGESRNVCICKDAFVQGRGWNVQHWSSNGSHGKVGERVEPLEKIRGCIGEDKYTEGVHDVYASLPKYGTFKNEVKVIDVDNDDDPPRHAAQKEASDSGNVDSDNGDSNDEDTDGGTDLEKMFPNVPGNDVDYVYTRNASGRVIAVDCCLKKG
jgi:hypothetical protein